MNDRIDQATVDEMKRYTEAVGSVCTAAENGNEPPEECLNTTVELVSLWVEAKQSAYSPSEMMESADARHLVKILHKANMYSVKESHEVAEELAEMLRPVHKTMVKRTAEVQVMHNKQLDGADDPMYY